MSIWGFFSNLFKGASKGSPDVVLSNFVNDVKEVNKAAAMRIPPEVISEPVQSIIRTLENGEWDFTLSWISMTKYYKFKHEWFGNEITLIRYLRGNDELSESWMTPSERVHVTRACEFVIYNQAREREAKQREKFMVLVEPTIIYKGEL